MGDYGEVDVLAEAVVDWHVELLLSHRHPDRLEEQRWPELDFAFEEFGDGFELLVKCLEHRALLSYELGVFLLLLLEFFTELLLFLSQIDVCH